MSLLWESDEQNEKHAHMESKVSYKLASVPKKSFNQMLMIDWFCLGPYFQYVGICFFFLCFFFFFCTFLISLSESLSFSLSLTLAAQ